MHYLRLYILSETKTLRISMICDVQVGHIALPNFASGTDVLSVLIVRTRLL